MSKLLRNTLAHARAAGLRIASVTNGGKHNHLALINSEGHRQVFILPKGSRSSVRNERNMAANLKRLAGAGGV